MDGPAAIARGTTGALRIGGLKAGRLTTWKVVISPTTGKPTLFAEGAFVRFYTPGVGCQAVAHLTPAPTPARIGRPKAPMPKPFVLTGKIVEFTARQIVLAEGEIT